MPRITTIGFDADDTLWQNEHFFRLTEGRFAELLADYAEPEQLGDHLLAVQRRTLRLYGFGIKGFILSMIETALEVTERRVPGHIIARIIEAGHEMLAHPVDLLPDAEGTIIALRDRYRLLLITKGDLFDQERKIASSGLADYFQAVEIVSDKTSETYRRIFDRHGDGAEQALMIGNSLKSDVVPALEANAWGVFVPHELTWKFEHVDEPADHPRFRKLERLGELAALLGEIDTDY
jgi:putative hydrolase of the HAD superfamily